MLNKRWWLQKMFIHVLDLPRRSICEQRCVDILRGLSERPREPPRRHLVRVCLPGGLLLGAHRSVRPLPARIFEPLGGRARGFIVRALRSNEVREKWRAMDFETLPSTPEELTRFVQADLKRWGEAVRLSGFKAAE